MPASSVEAYLAAVPEPGRSTLMEVRRRIREILPDANEGMSYGAPAFLVHGKAVVGYTASAGHLTYLPHSGSVLAGLADELAAYRVAKGSFRFPLDEPLPVPLLRSLIEARLDQLSADARRPSTPD